MALEIRISVRSLVEFILRGGDIDNRRVGGGDDAMLVGARIHRMLQKKEGPDYEAEVSLAVEEAFEDYSIRIEGRADGIIRRDGRVVVDEIKTTAAKLELIGKPAPLHLAQAKCYAYILASQEGLSQIGVRMTYCNSETLEVRYFHENYAFAELEGWYRDLLAEYRKWAEFESAHKKARNESIQTLPFPYPFREGQRELAGQVYRTITEEKRLFIQAPTGVGKTLSTVYPAVRAMGAGHADKLFYLTAKTVTAGVARDTFSLLSDRGLCFTTVSLTAKEKICPMEEAVCNPEACPFAKGHFDRINDALYDLLTTEDALDRDRILSHALEREVCPFEMSLDLSLFADAVICDYNYLFDPYVHLKRFFAQPGKGPYLFLVDEAHNLLERGRSMYSAQLLKEDVLELKRKLREHPTGLERGLDGLNRQLLALKKAGPGQIEFEAASGVLRALEKLSLKMGTFLEEHDAHPEREAILDYYFETKRFLDVAERFDEHYLAYTKMGEDGSFLLRFFCVDPSERLSETLEKGIAAILFSATFLPIQYYKKLLGGRTEDYEVYARTSFNSRQFALMIARDVTTKYSERGRAQYERIAGHIEAVVSARAGNYMVFCPSHSFLSEVADAYERLYFDPDRVSMILQKASMKEEEREAFLRRFEEGEKGRSLIGFCVMGGIFAEGIDLKGEKLIGAIVVGTGLVQVCEETELLRDYFDRRGESGFDFAYRYPGMNKVLQAGGRVIRTAQDRGVIALLDYRFCQRDYQKLFPREWNHADTVTLSNASEKTKAFWQDADKEGSRKGSEDENDA